MIARQRRHSTNRFAGESDGSRLVALGILLVTFGALTLASTLAIMPLPGHFGGSSALFGGIAIILFVVRTGTGAIYFDWIVLAVSSIGVGIVLYFDEQIADTLSLILVCTFLGSSVAARLWIGSTAFPRKAASWILASGCLGAISGLCVVAVWVFRMPPASSVILALDGLFQGLAIIGFGASLRETR
ncbi:hypothetical protein [Mesorhizobium sp. KR9-304]|uniref:hypothetical protein n=1 Tax=Mesorhizobium sp. KR9-304 TaxID=3156614 RepID=UPI0032B389FE